MKIKPVMPFNAMGGWVCQHCAAYIISVIDEDPLTKKPRLVPKSKYWNMERQEVYCGAECSLVRHEELRLTE